MLFIASWLDAFIGQVSPDGRWRWDGTAWRSTAELADPLPMPVWASIKPRADATWLMLPRQLSTWPTLTLLPRAARIAEAGDVLGVQLVASVGQGRFVVETVPTAVERNDVEIARV